MNVLAAQKALVDAERGGDENKIAAAKASLVEAMVEAETTSEGKGRGGA